MSATRVHPHHALPAPVVHQGFSISQSKSHVLAGVQDAYWNDEEVEDAECPLCLEEMDISDLNFKPCVCGYQICRFCWHHIKENLNKRCPACRRVYTDEGVEFKPISPQDHKRLTQQKKQRERERKELDALGRRHLANVRVVQRNVVYVVGIGPRFAKEELIPTLRSNEYFGQYGKITKIVLVKRTPSGGGAPVVGLYITYHRREDVARAIAAVDGTPSPGGGRDVMRASYGTTKYCMAFLRGATCSDHSCMNLHEWGDEKDCFTKEDLTTLKHTIKATESRTRTVMGKKGEEAEGLPRASAWGHKTSLPAASTSVSSNFSSSSTVPVSRQSRRGGSRQIRPVATESRPSNARVQQDRRSAKSTSQLSSRPSTPASLPPRPLTPAEAKSLQKKSSVPAQPPSPTPSGNAESEPGSVSPTKSSESLPPSVPPGLSAPPGLPSPARPPRAETASPQTPLLALQTSYQMSNAARALLDDVKARREAPPPSISAHSPFPDFDRTLQNLSGGDGGFGGFSFNLDPKLAGDDAEEVQLPDFEAEAQTPFIGTYVDAFPALRQGSPSAFMAPPGLSHPHNPSRAIYDPMSVRTPPLIERQSTGGSNYIGSFNPFAEQNEESSRVHSPTKSSFDDETRKVSRFGFARGRRGSTAASSPLHVPSPLSVTNSISETHSLYNSVDQQPHSPAISQWSLHSRQDYVYQQPPSAMGSPMLQHTQAQPYSQVQGRFPFFSSGISAGISEADLRDLIQSSRDRVTNSSAVRSGSAEQPGASGHQPFTDPAIMSARFASGQDVGYQPADHNRLNYTSPPGLVYPQASTNMPRALGMERDGPINGECLPCSSEEREDSVPTVQPPILSSSDFPALSSAVPSIDTTPSVLTTDEVSPEDLEAQEKADRKAAKRAAAAERAAERQKIAQEKAAAKAAEKARAALEKAAEKEKAAAVKAQQEKERLEKEKIKKEEAKAAREKERLVKAEREEKLAKLEKARAAQAEKDRELRNAIKEANALKAKLASEHAKITALEKSVTRQVSSPTPSETIQVPLLSKKPKKNKPIAKPARVSVKEEDQVTEETSTIFSAPDVPLLPSSKGNTVTSSSTNSRSQSVDRKGPTPLEDLLEDIHMMNPAMDLPNHPFFNLQKINPAAKMPLEYGPLVHALSALSVGGGTFANSVPSGSIDNAVSSFQQLLETLTQTISDLLRLLPRTTWDDSSSFDGVLRDMLKGDDFLDEGGEESQGKDDEVAALTLALERRARWMEVQLSKLEKLHRDINTAAVRAVLAFNDGGWDRHGFMPRVGNTLRRFDNMGLVEENGVVRAMTADELEKKLAVAREAAVFAETEVREMMENMQAFKPID
ncbi:uncharacterized protein BT62DRAFT_940348 [Guyanagaster necrorhizus]|uniref:RING-type domain-containing protein n=1 Tax=Guyanagaster necrorhizus TaxID=856835 RepID=A0A9P7W5P0_9AGAR|nr:uncharacterized protein BT62DRAFT_940348 [Guyanagaster necrorhizus MCA 3950]KAG7453054.1 hypothetical protein BT62DRAFT_940348 [Guyanagaster necrorhizus MCA 3950]